MSLTHRRTTRNNRYPLVLWSHNPGGTIGMVRRAPMMGIKPVSLVPPIRRILYRARPRVMAAVAAAFAFMAALSAFLPTWSASSTGRTGHANQEPTANTIPSSLARAIHARLGPVPLGLGVAPMVTGIERQGGGW